MKLELPETGGLYRFSNVTYRGVQIGKVTAVGPTASGAEATLSLDASPKIPADVHAAVRSISAVGEQYIDLVPRSESAPYLRDGSVINARDTSIPPPVKKSTITICWSNWPNGEVCSPLNGSSTDAIVAPRWLSMK